LGDHGRNEHNSKYAGADQISAVVRIYVCVQPGHRHRIAARFAERRGQDLYDPEGQRDLWDLARCFPQKSSMLFHVLVTLGKCRIDFMEEVD
jgi:hypothetical protein